MASGAPQYADVPAITLAPHQSQLLDMTSVLASAGLTNFTGSVNLVFDANEIPGSLLASGGSVDKANTYVFGVYPRGIREGASKSLSYWSTANGDDTMVTVWNPADEPQSFIFRLNYSGGYYLLPIQLGAKATQAFNISDVIRSGTPDAEGNIIPPSAHEGSATLMGSRSKIENILVAVDAATYNVKKATCGSQCWSCDGNSFAFIELSGFSVGSGGQTQEHFFGMYDDTNYESDYTSQASWWSDHNSIMTVNTGAVTGHSPGTANISAFASNVPVYNPNFCCESCLYCDTGVGGGSPGTTFQFVVSGNPFIFVGTDPNIISANTYFATNGNGSSPQPPGGTCCGASSDTSDGVAVTNGSLPTFKFTTLDQSAAPGDRTLTFEYRLSSGEATSQQMSVTARKFFYLANASPSNQCQALGGQYGYFYIYTYTPYTHPDGNPIDTNSGLGGTAVNETVDPQAGGTVCTNSTETGDGSLRSEGIFTDQVSLCSNSPIPTCDKKYTQVFKVAGYPVRTNTLEYTNTQLIYTNQGPTQ